MKNYNLKFKNKIFITKNFEETQKLGKEFTKKLKGGETLALYGELGAGKTTFVQGLAKGLGIKRRLISPTFIIVRKYKIGFMIHDLRFKNFYHIDLYRIDNTEDIKGLGIEEIMNNPQNIVAIEWAEKIEKLLPKERVDIHLEYLDENKRKITISYGK